MNIVARGGLDALLKLGRGADADVLAMAAAPSAGQILIPGRAVVAARVLAPGLIEVALDSFAALDDGLAGGIGALALLLPAGAAGNVVAMPLRRQSA